MVVAVPKHRHVDEPSAARVLREAPGEHRVREWVVVVVRLAVNDHHPALFAQLGVESRAEELQRARVNADVVVGLVELLDRTTASRHATPRSPNCLPSRLRPMSGASLGRQPVVGPSSGLAGTGRHDQEGEHAAQRPRGSRLPPRDDAAAEQATKPAPPSPRIRGTRAAGDVPAARQSRFVCCRHEIRDDRGCSSGRQGERKVSAFRAFYAIVVGGRMLVPP